MSFILLQFHILKMPNGTGRPGKKIETWTREGIDGIQWREIGERGTPVTVTGKRWFAGEADAEGFANNVNRYRGDAVTLSDIVTGRSFDCLLLGAVLKGGRVWLAPAHGAVNGNYLTEIDLEIIRV